MPRTPNTRRPRAPLTPADEPAGLRGLLFLPFRRQTWRYALYGLLLPLALGLVLALQYPMKAAQDHGHQPLGSLILLLILVVVAVVGPGFERVRARFWLGEEIGRRAGDKRFVRHAVFFVLNMLVGALGFAAVAGWLLVSARNLTYPVWGWRPYPDPAWGGPHPIGVVALHFAAGVVTFFAGPWVIVRLAGLQVHLARRFIGSGQAG
ncbi:sensor domain-containing protein [Streptomyces sp. NBC_01257]|uniref:sensor domain-containing protein n=1 Tax=Streptomyces sp. NBC_01257 TaxID=2903799 RepID=UPI002DD8E9A7|nr:sensor domain-containing protein [Streptomyces sp. NBC_01257]WRZ66335.1 sensor domain-containing protein [Streptomyces sp. NBC_01257]